MNKTHFTYLDHAATSPLLPEVKEAMIKAMELPGNASSLHRLGHAAHNLIEEARAEVAKLIGAADPAEVIFTSGGSESNNTVIKTFADHPITVSAIEHSSVLEPAKSVASKLTILPVNSCGFIEKIKIKNQRLISVMLANNELGTIQNIKEFAHLAHTQTSYFHTDATQALGKIPINVQDLGVDYLTASAHKIGGPVGIGILYVKKGSPLKPLIQGGHQEHSLRAGTYNTVSIAGLGAAAKFANDHKTWQIYDQKIRSLRDQLARRILAEIPHSSINGLNEQTAKTFYEQHVSESAQSGKTAFCEQMPKTVFYEQYTPKRCRSPRPHSGRASTKPFLSSTLPNILNCSFAAAEGESIQLYLDLEGGVIVSTGSACASGDGKPSHVLMATHGDAEVAHSSIRFSLGLDTRPKDIDQVMQTLPNIIKKLQGISTIPTPKSSKTFSSGNSQATAET